MSLFKGPPIGHHIMPFGLRSGPLQNGQRGHSINIFCIVCLTLGFLACHVRASKEKPLDLESKSCLLIRKGCFLKYFCEILVSISARDDKFYTTRFGRRSDPSMQKYDSLQVRIFHPECYLICMFSLRNFL